MLAGAGCTLPQRDAVDRRVVDDVKNGTGKLINHPSEVGGWPELASGTPPADSDHDGMPDDWEKSYRLNPNDPSDGPRDADGDGYTNVEEYLNGTEPRPNKKTGARRHVPRRKSATTRADKIRKPHAQRLGIGFLKLRQVIINGVRSGQKKWVYVDLAGSLTRGRLVGADRTGITVAAAGVEVPLAWHHLTPRRLDGLATKFAGDRGD